MTTAYFRANVAAVIRNDRGEVLLLRRNLPAGSPVEWMFPQGGIERGETAEAAVIREAGEEAGIPAERLRIDRAAAKFIAYTHAVQNPPGELGQAQRWFLLAAAPGTEAVPDQVEFAEARWVPATRALDEVPAYRLEVYAEAFQLLGLGR